MDTDTRLTAKDVADNYTTFREYSDKIRFKDLIEGKNACKCGSDGCESEKLKKRVADLEAELKRKDSEASVAFSIMERAVRDDPDVKALRDALSKKKSNVLHNMCMGDDGYLMAYTAFRTGIERAYKRDMNTPKIEEIKEEVKE